MLINNNRVSLDFPRLEGDECAYFILESFLISVNLVRGNSGSH